MARWAVNSLARLHWRGWGAESVVLEAVSGEMTVLDALEAAVMACFESGPSDLQTLTDELASDLSLEADDDLKARLRAIIEDFVVRGWLQPAESV